MSLRSYQKVPEHMRLRQVVLLLYLLSICTLLSGCEQHRQPLLVAVAANMHMPMQAIATSFTEQSGVAVELIVGSSGKLVAQVEAGAPYDLYLSADARYANRLTEANLTESRSVSFAKGHLLLWWREPMQLKSLQDLLKPEVKKIVIANPAHAPYGRAAIEALEQQQLLGRLQHKLIYAESISQVNHLMLQGAAQVALTGTAIRRSDHWSKQDKYLLLPDSIHQPICQTVAVVKNSRRKAAAQVFYTYLLSARAQDTLQVYGYSIAGTSSCTDSIQ